MATQVPPGAKALTSRALLGGPADPTDQRDPTEVVSLPPSRAPPRERCQLARW
jgi:hypothetical protein